MNIELIRTGDNTAKNRDGFIYERIESGTNESIECVFCHKRVKTLWTDCEDVWACEECIKWLSPDRSRVVSNAERAILRENVLRCFARQGGFDTMEFDLNLAVGRIIESLGLVRA